MYLIYAVFSLFTWFEIIVLFIAFMPFQLLLFVLTAPFDKHRKIMHYHGSLWASLALFLSPVFRIKITGKEYLYRKKNYILVMNHQSLLDILLSFRLFYPAKMIGKKVLAMVPVIGWNLFLSGHIMVDRHDRKSQFNAIRRMEAILESGDSMLIFPEGTRTRDGNISEFKKGAFRSATATGTDVLPIVLNGAYQALPKSGFIVNGVYTLSMTVLPPIPVEKGKDPAALAKESFQLMSAKLSELNNENQRPQ